VRVESVSDVYDIDMAVEITESRLQERFTPWKDVAYAHAWSGAAQRLQDGYMLPRCDWTALLRYNGFRNN
jgi:hypothetical protein